jgi:protein-disulfide isomerase
VRTRVATLLLCAALAACEEVGPSGSASSPAVAGMAPAAAGRHDGDLAAPPGARAQAEDSDADHAVYNVPVGKSPVRGSPTALVTIVEFADYQCPYCLRGEMTLRALSAEYGDKIRIVFKNEPLGFHEGAEPAAEGALELRDEKGDAAFWTMHDRLLENQGDLDADTVTRIAVDLGANPDKVRAAIEKRAHQDDVDADLDLADDLQAEGTPHFFVNGIRVAGAQPREAFEAIINAQIPRAQALVQGGTPPAQVYEALTGKGRGAPEPPHVAFEGLPADDPSRGPATARVTLHEFGDFQCPYCAVAEATVRRIAQSYGDQVRVVWHDLPLSFHEHAIPAARAAREARVEGGDAAFWKMHDTFLANPRKLTQVDIDADAKALGLDAARWKAAMGGDAHTSAIEADKHAAAAMGIEGTPAFVVAATGAPYGYLLWGAQPYTHFRKLVERALAEGAAHPTAAAAPPPRQP